MRRYRFPSIESLITARCRVDPKTAANSKGKMNAASLRPVFFGDVAGVDGLPTTRLGISQVVGEFFAQETT
jgi:hypothetical protein